jgi:hypothetical protein
VGEHGGGAECGGCVWAAVLPTEAVLAARVVARRRTEEAAALHAEVGAHTFQSQF